MQWRLENTNNQLIVIWSIWSRQLGGLWCSHPSWYGQLLFIFVFVFAVDCGVILCDMGNCYLSSGVLSPVSCMGANAGLLSPTKHPSTLSLNRECIGRVHKMPPCVPRAVRAVQKDVSQRKCFNCPKLCYGHSTNPSMEVEMRKSWAPIHSWFKEVSLTYEEKQKCRHNWKSIKAK